MKFADATAVTQLDSHTYSAKFIEDWCIGTVPHGGYVTSTFQQVVKKHFDTTLRKQNQPHTLALHLDFLRRTQTGQATFSVKDVKLGRQTSVVHVTLSQGTPGDEREEVVGYITQSNLRTERGVSYDTDWQCHPQPPPVDVSKLNSDTDENWGERKVIPFQDFRKAALRARSWYPKAGQLKPSIVDQWVCLKDEGDLWTNESLGFVIDNFPQIIENFHYGEDMYSVQFEKEHGHMEDFVARKGAAKMWYPTVLLNLDVKKALPEQGVRFLYVRLQAKQIKNGRYDLEIVVRDPAGDLVALSYHVCFAVGAERNTSARRKAERRDGTKL